MVSLRSKRKRVLIRRCTALLGVGALVGILLAVSSPVRTGATQPLTPPFSVYKNTIVDANGNPFFFRGAVSPSLGGSCIGDTVTNGPGPIPASDFTTMANTWGANAVTIYVNEDYWLYPATQLDTNNQPCTNYHSVVEQAISNAEAAGLVVILGSAFSQIGGSGPPQYHVPFCGSHTSNLPCLGQWCLPDAVYSVNAWQSLAQTFGNDPKVFFEPYSEPHDVSWSKWRNGGTITCSWLLSPSYTYQGAGMQQLANAIRGTGAENVILASGPAWAHNLSRVLGGLPPSGFALTGDNVGYSVHSRDPHSTAWDNLFGRLASSVPVVATEVDVTPRSLRRCPSSTYVSSIMPYFNAHGIGYTAWAWIAPGPGGIFRGPLPKSPGCEDGSWSRTHGGLDNVWVPGASQLRRACEWDADGDGARLDPSPRHRLSTTDKWPHCTDQRIDGVRCKCVSERYRQ